MEARAFRSEFDQLRRAHRARVRIIEETSHFRAAVIHGQPVSVRVMRPAHAAGIFRTQNAPFHLFDCVRDGRTTRARYAVIGCYTGAAGWLPQTTGTVGGTHREINYYRDSEELDDQTPRFRFDPEALRAERKADGRHEPRLFGWYKRQSGFAQGRRGAKPDHIPRG